MVKLPKDYEVYDFSKGYDPNRVLKSSYGIGKYAEQRPNMYKGDLFEQDQRDIHIGLDIAAPINTPVFAFAKGSVFLYGNNNNPYDYGPTIITKHLLNHITVYALHGHLSLESLAHIKTISSFQAGDIIGYIGSKEVNGGWNPHLHFQLSLLKPETYDLPGVVHQDQLEWALQMYPDPQFVLGKLYS